MSNALLLARVGLFDELPAGEVEELASAMRSRRYARGEVIFLRGDPGSTLYVIQEGSVKISLASPDGKEAILNLLGPGDFFGDLALLDEEPRSTDAVAIEKSVLHLLDQKPFHDFLGRHPTVATRLLAVLSRRLRRNADIVQDSTFLDVAARLARALLHLAETYGEEQGDGILVRRRLTQGELAGIAGTTRESVNKWLGFYERRGLVRYEKGQITVLDAKGLQKRIV